MHRFWEGLARLIGRRYKQVLALALLVTVALAIGTHGLKFETSQESLVGADNPVSKDNHAYQTQFGGEFMLVLITAQPGHTIVDLMNDANRAALSTMDEKLHASGQFHAVLSPIGALTFANNQVPVGQDMFAASIKRESEEATAKAKAENKTSAEQAAAAAAAVAPLQAGLTDNLTRAGAAVQGTDINPLAADPKGTRLASESFVRFLLYSDAKNIVIRPILRDNFPDQTHALVIVYLKGNIDIAAMDAGVKVVDTVVSQTHLDGFTMIDAGAPVYLRDINNYLQGGMASLGGLAVLVMVFILWFVFRVRWRLLSLIIVVLGAIWTFGIMGYLGIALSLITISGLPILIGIGVDFSIQTHSRFEEELDRDGDGQHALRRLMTHLVPAIAVAMIAATVGFLVLQLSSVPLIRDFGVMLAIGVTALIIAAVTVPSSILAWREHRRPTTAGHASVPHGPIERVVRAVTLSGVRFLPAIAIVCAVVIVAGFSVEGRFTIQTDPVKWVPQSGKTIKNLNQLQDDTGFSSEFSLLVSAKDVTATPVSEWMQRFTDLELGKHKGVLLRGTSLAAVAKSVTGVAPGQTEINLLLGDALKNPPTYNIAPKDFVQAFMSSDKTKAALIFPIAPVSLGEREKLIDAVKADLAKPPAGITANVVGGPPAGTSVKPAGLAVIGVELVKALESNRTLMTYVALLAVALWLLIFYRRFAMMWLPLVPVTTAVALAALIVYLLGLELSPLTAVGGPIVIAIATEFSVLVIARYIEEREAGRTREDAVGHGAVRIARAFVSSGLTVIGGFAVLAFSSYPLLRDFGIVIALDVLAALVSTLVVLPPLLMWADHSRFIPDFHPGSAATDAAELPM